MLVGRNGERHRLDRALRAARDGRGSTIVVRGEAGIGKSRLLRFAEERAAAGGMRVLFTRGVEAEAELSFSGIAELLASVLGHLEDIPSVQSAALAGALALGPPVAGDRFTICAATMSLLARVAEMEPLAVLVDDAHWLDAASRECLVFTARRAAGGGMTLIFSVRDDEPVALDDPGLDQLHVGRLPARDSRRLLRGNHAPKLDGVVEDAVLEAAAGNPLALIELPAMLTPGQRAGAEPLDRPLPVGRGLERAFARRVGRLPDPSRRALVLVACDDGADPARVTAACRSLGVEPAAALEPAELEGLLVLGPDRITFRHPLARGAVYHGATPAERREAHRALAGVMSSDADAERRAWHLAGAAVGPDEEASVALEAAAQHAQARSGYAAAAAAFERSAGLTPASPLRATRLLGAAGNAVLAGENVHALALLARALPLAATAQLRAAVQHVRGQVLLWREPEAAYQILSAEAGPIAPVDPDLAAEMFVYAAAACHLSGRFELALATARSAVRLETRAGASSTLARSCLGSALMLTRGARRADDVMADLDAALDAVPPLGPHALALVFALHTSLQLEDFDRCRRVSTRVVEAARTASAPGALPVPLAISSDLHFRTGDWAAASAAGREAIDLCRETQQDGLELYCLAQVSRFAAARGDEERCRADASRVLSMAGDRGVGLFPLYARGALGLLELGNRRPEMAIEWLGGLEADVQQLGLRDPAVVQWTPDLIEALVHTGRIADARRNLARFAEEVGLSGRRWGRAALARCRGLLDEREFDRHFAEAMSLHEGLPMPFERARTQLAHGGRLRRARRRADARAPLRAALATFESLGAQPWAERARSELSAAGGRVRAPVATLTAALTPQELQVALLVADGATNRDAATRLFLSAKTIEAHLSSVYRKLGLRSRAQLAALVARGDHLRGEGWSSGPDPQEADAAGGVAPP